MGVNSPCASVVGHRLCRYLIVWYLVSPFQSCRHAVFGLPHLVAFSAPQEEAQLWLSPHQILLSKYQPRSHMTHQYGITVLKVCLDLFIGFNFLVTLTTLWSLWSAPADLTPSSNYSWYYCSTCQITTITFHSCVFMATKKEIPDCTSQKRAIYWHRLIHWLSWYVCI